MTDIVEAMARARHNAWAEEWSKLRPDEGRPLWEDLSPECVEVSLRAERAALTAALDHMREPSEAVERAWKEIDAVRFDWGTAHQFHEATIDQLRKESLP